MNAKRLCLGICLGFYLTGYSATYYVDKARPDDSGNGLSWDTAKRTIQAAVDAASASDTILVRPGVYDEGTRISPDSYLYNRLVCTKNLAIESTDGAETTVIMGARDATDTSYQGTGAAAVRCVYMTTGTLKGFTLTGGASGSETTDVIHCRGGGLYSPNAATPVLYDCIVSNNAARRGGGAYGGTFHRSLISGNYASQNGAGVRFSRLYDSLIVFNKDSGAVAYSHTTNDVVNCTIARNTDRGLDNSGAANSIIVENGTGNQGTYHIVNSVVDFTPQANYFTNCVITTNARFVDSANGNFRLLADSPALDAGNPALFGWTTAPAGRTDFYGNARIQGAQLDIGAVEGVYAGASVAATVSGSGSLVPSGTHVLPTLPTQLVFTATANSGAALRHFTVNGAKMPDSGDTFTLNITRPGGYTVQAVFLAARYVDASEGDDANDGTSPAAAWRTLQYAVDTAPVGGMVLAAPGTYSEGRTYNASHSNRVSITRNVVLKSSTGAEQTFIVGAKDDTPAADPYGRGTNAVRCVYMSNGALEGFTLTGGATGVSANDADGDPVRGGGLYASGTGIELWDCIISNNVASRGSAAWGGTIRRSRIANNRTTNSGNSVIRTAFVYDSLIVNNISAWAFAFNGARAVNCTIADNIGGGINDQAVALNTIIYGNSGTQVGGGAFCTNSLTGGGVRPGAGNLSADPRFVDAPSGDYRLRADSPGVNAGNLAFLTHIDGTDFAGAARVQGNGVNMGALESAVSVVTATSTSGGAIEPSGTTLFTGDLTFTAVPWEGRAFRRFEVNGEPVPGGDTSLTINADTFSSDAAITVHAVFQDGFYVDAAAGDDANDGLEPETPLQTLQAAVDLALAGDTVRVVPGFYNAGFALSPGGLTNRLAITKPISVVAIQGPHSTFIVGARSQNPSGCGSDAVRCVYMSDGTLQGFTLTGGATDASGGATGEDFGGGLAAESGSNATVIDCVISNNIASVRGGGVSLGYLHRCWIADNHLAFGGSFGSGVRGSTVYDSVVTGNGAPSAIAFGTLHNVTAYNTSPVQQSDVWNSILINPTGDAYVSTSDDRKVYSSCLSGTLRTPNNGGSNIFSDPYFIDPAARDFRLHKASPCVDSGNVAYGPNRLGLDYAGQPRLQGANIDRGAYEGGLGGLRVLAQVSGGGAISPAGTFYSADLPAQQSFEAVPWPGRTLLHFSTNGVPVPNTGVTITLSSAVDSAINLTAHFSGTLYVDATRPDDSGDGTAWETAKRTIQGAVDVATDDDTILVAPGLYNEGTVVTPTEKSEQGYLLNRVVITSGLTLRSRDGAATTVIQGAFDTGSADPYGRGPNAVRCVYMSRGTLQGFTLTGGATDSLNFENENNRGGGVYVPENTYTPLVLDCIFTNNASVRGGGIHAGTVKHSVFIDNYAQNNSSALRGSHSHHCLVVRNRTGGSSTGSAAGYGWAYNCTFADNEGRDGDNMAFYNSILTRPSISGRHFDSCLSGGTVTPITNVNAFTDAPLFVNADAGDYRLAQGSPCIDRANHAYVDNRFGTDLSGDLRMQNARIDLGAFEYNWRPAFAAALDGRGIAVTEITPFVTHAEAPGLAGGNAVYLDGHAARTNQLAAVSLTAPWQIPFGKTVYLSFEVTGSGTLSLYEDETLITTAQLADGYQTFKYRAIQNPCPLRAVYTVGAQDTGGAILDDFKDAGGMILFFK